MTFEEKLVGWTAPSSDTEQEKQERTVRMIREAVSAHSPFRGCNLSVYAKGSYANNTNVRADSDVDVAVECTDAEYWEESSPGLHTPGSQYTGPWTPARLRLELGAAMKAQFGAQVDTSGSTAIEINSGTARVDADVVPCFSYAYYMPGGASRQGTKIFRADGTSLVNFPSQQLQNGTAKNVRTATSFKRAVRILKRVENAMVVAGRHREVASYFIECLAYNCPDSVLNESTWTATVRGMLAHISRSLDGDEPVDEPGRWLEVNECFFLFHGGQKWTRRDGRDFANAAWTFLGYQ